MKKIYAPLAVVVAALSFVSVSCATTSSTASSGTSSESGTSLGTKTLYASTLGNFDPVSLP